MKVIGLCGGSGSGKGRVCEIFAELGVPSIDTDLVYRDMTLRDSPCLRALRQEFGDKVVSQDGSLNRAFLRTLVFGGDNATLNRDKLNSITHKFILDETRNILSQYERAGVLAAIVDAPLLFESGFASECDLTVCVTADEGVRISRIALRDGISESDAKKRISGQIPDEELSRRCDFVIKNDGDITSLRQQVVNLHKKIII